MTCNLFGKVGQHLHEELKNEIHAINKLLENIESLSKNKLNSILNNSSDFTEYSSFWSKQILLLNEAKVKLSPPDLPDSSKLNPVVDSSVLDKSGQDKAEECKKTPEVSSRVQTQKVLKIEPKPTETPDCWEDLCIEKVPSSKVEGIVKNEIFVIGQNPQNDNKKEGANKQKIIKVTMPKLHVKPQSYEKVTFSYLGGTDEMYLHFFKMDGDIRKMEDTINSSQIFSLICPPYRGEYVLSNSSSGIWCRSKIIDVYEDSCKVLCCDYGFSETVPFTRLGLTNFDFLKEPFYAVHFIPEGIYMVENSKEYLNSLSEKVINVKINKVCAETDIMHVTGNLFECNKLLSIEQEMVEKGLALKSSTQYPDLKKLGWIL